MSRSFLIVSRSFPGHDPEVHRDMIYLTRMQGHTEVLRDRETFTKIQREIEKYIEIYSILWLSELFSKKTQGHTDI